MKAAAKIKVGQIFRNNSPSGKTMIRVNKVGTKYAEVSTRAGFKGGRYRNDNVKMLRTDFAKFATVTW